MDGLAQAAAIGLILAVTLPYLIGSIPFGYLLARRKGYGDIRQLGSGSTGATNVLRTGDKKLAAQVMLLDVLKGFVVGAAFGVLNPTLGYIAGFVAILGHVFPVWLKFKGGKGVTVFFGTLLGLNPLVAVIGALAWAAIGKTTRVSAVASLAGVLTCLIAAWLLASPGGPLFVGLHPTATTIFGYFFDPTVAPNSPVPLLSYLLPDPGTVKYCTWCFAFLLLTHAGNIKRLLKGEEKSL